MHYGGLINVFITVSAISLVLDWYVFSGLRTLTADWRSVAARNLVTFGYLLISSAIIVLFIGGAGAFSTAQGMRPYHEYTLSLFITFLITKLFFMIVLAVGDLGRLLFGIGDGVFGKKHQAGQPFFPGRRKFISEMAVLAASFPFFWVYVWDI